MNLVPDRIRIQNTLVDFAMGGTFHPVAYAVAGSPAPAGARHAIVDTTRSVQPQSAVCNETRSTFVPAKIQRRGASVDRDQWFFQLLLAFSGEVTFEAFERALTDWQAKLAPDSTHDKAVRIQLFQATYQHSTQQEPTPGSKATYTIIARVSPN